ncbi:MAG: hypothetical protein AAFR87_12130, partial [Bacteroidota bacterium]
MRNLLCLLVFFLIQISLSAQSHVFYENGHEITSFMESEIFKDDIGLISQHDDGQLWITCYDALYRYDGTEFEKLNLDQSHEILNIGRQIEETHPDSKGNIWLIRLGGGIGKYDTRTHQYKNIQID